MIVRTLIIGALALVLTGSLLELSCLAGEARSRDLSRSGALTDAFQPELPVAPELEGDDLTLPPALTR